MAYLERDLAGMSWGGGGGGGGGGGVGRRNEFVLEPDKKQFTPGKE